MVTVSIIIPVYRDRAALERTLDFTDFGDAQLIVVSTIEDSASLAELRNTRRDIQWIESPRGRARQMNAGAAVARGDWLMFLHADTRLAHGWRQELAVAASNPRTVLGCFRFALDSGAAAARLLELGVRWRVAVFGLPYGDQALFVRGTVFQAVGGYADLSIMEDVDLVRRLRARGALFCSALPAVTSARRWEQDGWLRRSAINVVLILLYFLRVPPSTLERLAQL